MRFRRSVVPLVAMMLCAAACGGGDPPTTPSNTISVNVDPSGFSLKVGEQKQCKATVSGPAGIPQGVNWRSLDESVATVTSTGLVTALAEGTATIRVSWLQSTDEFRDVVVQVTSAPIITEVRRR